jgi:hypothetical protein
MDEIKDKNMRSDDINKDKEKAITEMPVLQFSVPCDGIAREKHNKPVFVGVFSSILRPSIIPQFFIVNRWINGIGEFEQIVKVLDPDLKEVVKSECQKFKLDSKAKSADLFSGFININFEKSGVYWISVELNGNMVLSYPLPVFNK